MRGRSAWSGLWPLNGLGGDDEVAQRDLTGRPSEHRDVRPLPDMDDEPERSGDVASVAAAHVHAEPDVIPCRPADARRIDSYAGRSVSTGIALTMSWSPMQRSTRSSGSVVIAVRAFSCISVRPVFGGAGRSSA